MRFPTFFKSLTSTSTRRRPTRRRSPASRLYLEALEDRRLLSFTVGDYDIGIFPSAALAADFNNDLVQDLALSYASPSGPAVSVRLGNGNGTFGAAQSFPTGGGSTESIAAADFNGDGNIDLALGDGSLSAPPTVLFGNGDGTLQAPQSVYLGMPPAPDGTFFYSLYTTDVAVADANADGSPDLLFIGEVTYLSNNGEEFYIYGYTAAFLGNGNGGFPQAFGVRDEQVIVFGTPGAGEFVAADLNADGKVDMVGANRARYGLGDGTFSAWQDFGGPQGNHVAVDDFNGDGKLDIAATNAPIPYGPPASGGFIRLNNGDGTFQPAQSYLSGPEPGLLATADFNGDGKADLVTANGEDDSTQPNIWPSVTVCLGNGNGTFQAPLSFPIAPSYNGYPSGVAVADFNGDGRADLAVTALVFTPSTYNLRVLLNDGIWTSVSISDVSVSEGNTGSRNATFTVTLAAATGQPVTVAYATADGAATAGSDYQAKNGTLTFAPGETSKTVTVLVNGDRLPETNESFFVNLSTPSNAFIADGQGVSTILDDEPRISISDVTKKEGNGKKTTLFVFTVTLSAAYDQPVTMSFRTVNDTATTSDNDYVAKTGTLTFAPGETTKTITIQVKGDSKKEADETFYLDLFGNSSNSLFSKYRGLGTILNDD